MNSSIGEALKEARIRKSITLEDVHAKLKIHPRVLQLLEENKFDKLPSPLFVKSFLRSYADFLEVNPNEIVKTYEREGEKAPEQVLFIKPAQHKEKIRTPFQIRKNMIIGSAAILLGFAVFSVPVFYILKSTGGKEIKHSHPNKNAKAAKPESPVLPPKTTSSPIPRVTTSSYQKNSEEWLRSPQLGNFPSLDKQKPLELRVKALDNVWMRVTCDGKVLFQSVLKKGASESWSANASVEIWSGNASNMSLSLNGAALGPVSKGVVKKMVITHQGIKVAH